MAEPVTPRDWRRKRASHTSTTALHLPPELAEWAAEITQQINALQAKVQALETADLRRTQRDAALVQGLEQFAKDKRGAA